jgi:methionyl-tRNA formyltransferase
MRLVFFGTSGFGEPTLRALAGRHEVCLVVTLPDAPAGRGRKLQPSPIKLAAQELGLPLLQPERLWDPLFINRLRVMEADLFFVLAFRILPREVFTLPQRGTVNLHASLLPDYRGAAPINRAIMNGDDRTGLTTFFITEQVDAGDIILQEELAIGPDETAGELADRMKVLGADLSLRTIDAIERGTIFGKPQKTGTGRPAPKLFREDRIISWDADARSIHNQVRGLSPDPGAFIECAGGPVKVLRTELLDDNTPGIPGTVIACSERGGMVVAAGRGALRIVEMQPPGKRVLTSACYLRGHRVEPGTNIGDIC